MVTNWLLTGPRLCHFKIGNVAQLVTIKNCASLFLSAEAPMFIVLLDKQPFKKTNVAQLVTIKNPQMWPR